MFLTCLRLATAVPLIALLLSGVAPTAARSCEAPGVPPELVTGLLGWIAKNSDYDPNVVPPPEIRFCQTAQSVAYEGARIVVDARLKAFYDLTNQRVHLVLPWQADLVENQSTLLHELVHHLQFQSRDWDCDAATETEAYALQALWLTEQGLDPPFTPAQAGLLALCPSDVHP